MSEKNIYQRINAVMKQVQYVQKDAQIQGYKAVTHDQVVSLARAAMVEHGIVIEPHQSSGFLEPKTEDSKMRLYGGMYKIDFVNIDKPEDRASVDVEAHAADNSDKAPGKALTYATKAAVLKILWLETGVNDESRTGETINYTDHQKAQFDELLESDKATEFVVFSQAVGPEIMMALNNSFVKGTISQGKAKCKALERTGWDIIKDYGATLKLLIENNDPAVAEIIDELTVDEKRLVANQLTQSEIEYLKAI